LSVQPLYRWNAGIDGRIRQPMYPQRQPGSSGAILAA
jgi:hypothetical protein